MLFNKEMYPEKKGKQLEGWKSLFTNRCNYVKKQQEKLYNVDSPRAWKGFRSWVKRVFPSFGNIVADTQWVCNIVAATFTQRQHVSLIIVSDKLHKGKYSQEQLTDYLTKRKAFVSSVERICLGPENETITLVNSKGNCTFLEKIDRKRLELDCSEKDGWFVLDDSIKVNKGKEVNKEEEAPRAEYYRHQLHAFLRNLYRFFAIPYEDQLTQQSVFFIFACFDIDPSFLMHEE